MYRKIILTYLCICLFLLTTVLCAQEERVTADDVVAKMGKRLNLTQEQAQKAKPIIEEYINKCRALIQGSGEFFVSNKKKAVQAQINQLREEKNKKLSNILTTDQMRKLDQSESIKGYLNQDENDNSDRTPDGKSSFGLGNSF